MPRKKTVSDTAVVSTKYTVIERLKNAARVQKAENEKAFIPEVFRIAEDANEDLGIMLKELGPPTEVRHYAEIWAIPCGLATWKVGNAEIRIEIDNQSRYEIVLYHLTKGTLAHDSKTLIERIGRLLAEDEADAAAKAAQAAK